MELTITKPDDWHLHLRDGSLLEAVLPHSAQHFGRAIVMPNLKPPITTTTVAVAYRESILKAIPKDSNFTPLMTLYLTDMTTSDEIKLASESNQWGAQILKILPTKYEEKNVLTVSAGALDKLEAFTSFNGPDFYGLPRNKLKIKLRKAPWKVPDCLSFPFGDIVPMFAGETLEWQALPC